MPRIKDLEKRIRQLLHQKAPGAKVILFGSYARGDAQEDSDIDLLILLKQSKIKQSDFDKIAYPLIELGWKQGVYVSPKLYTFDQWQKRSFTPFYKNVEAEGIEI
jgi:predicted nucleotidyltransferase